MANKFICNLNNLNLLEFVTYDYEMQLLLWRVILEK